MNELRSWRETDAANWDRFVATADGHAFPQLWPWGALRDGRGWTAVRLAVGDGRVITAGAQVLVRRLPLIGSALAYVPRGPIGDLADPAVRVAMEAALRELAAAERVGLLRVDPERGPDDPFGAALLAPPWTGAPKVQPPTSRLIDLRRPETELRAELRPKHRQYVAKASRAGITVERFDPGASAAATDLALADFYRIYRDTALRAGFAFRVGGYYRRVWDAFASSGRAALSFAVLDGERVATLFHLTCGDRVAEVYGGMLPAAAESRANYLLKWEAVRAFQAEGLATYDLWGLATGGIRQFKEGFGGHEVAYLGTRELVTSAAGAAAIRAVLPLYGGLQRLRARRDRSIGQGGE